VDSFVRFISIFGKGPRRLAVLDDLIEDILCLLNLMRFGPFWVAHVERSLGDIRSKDRQRRKEKTRNQIQGFFGHILEGSSIAWCMREPLATRSGVR